MLLMSCSTLVRLLGTSGRKVLFRHLASHMRELEACAEAFIAHGNMGKV
jgi:hypothetical protein